MDFGGLRASGDTLYLHRQQRYEAVLLLAFALNTHRIPRMNIPSMNIPRMNTLIWFCNIFFLAERATFPNA